MDTIHRCIGCYNITEYETTSDQRYWLFINQSVYAPCLSPVLLLQTTRTCTMTLPVAIGTTSHPTKAIPTTFWWRALDWIPQPPQFRWDPYAIRFMALLESAIRVTSIFWTRVNNSTSTIRPPTRRWDDSCPVNSSCHIKVEAINIKQRVICFCCCCCGYLGKATSQHRLQVDREYCALCLLLNKCRCNCCWGPTTTCWPHSLVVFFFFQCVCLADETRRELI